MKTKLLTICLLLVTSQVFAIDYQVRFENIVKSVRIKFDNSNEIIKQECKRDRDNQFKKLLPDKKIQKWQGVVNRIQPNNDGDVLFAVKLPYSNTIIRNTTIRKRDRSKVNSNTIIENARLPTKEWSKLIKKNSKIYSVIRTLNEGDAINFSGYFLSSNFPVDGICCGSWHISELSYTEEGGMHEPEFAFVFENVERRGRLDDLKFREKATNNPYFTDEELSVDPDKVDPVKIETVSDEEIIKEFMMKKERGDYSEGLGLPEIILIIATFIIMFAFYLLEIKNSRKKKTNKTEQL